tara:strand:- start:1092 stop:1502 length:411 start_codon:yes stop_codon:yes gene_type:complete
MADALTSQVIQDGPRNAILKFTNVSDGTGQALAVLVDVSTLSADPLTKQVCNGVTLQSITYSNVGMGVELFWDATTNIPLLNLLTDWSDQLDFSDFGIPNDAAAGKTGDILVTTSAATAGDTYTLVLTLTKSYVSV